LVGMITSTPDLAGSRHSDLLGCCVCGQPVGSGPPGTITQFCVHSKLMRLPYLSADCTQQHIRVCQAVPLLLQQPLEGVQRPAATQRAHMERQQTADESRSQGRVRSPHRLVIDHQCTVITASSLHSLHSFSSEHHRRWPYDHSAKSTASRLQSLLLGCSNPALPSPALLTYRCCIPAAPLAAPPHSPTRL
jgi:hypothetical protein